MVYAVGGVHENRYIHVEEPGMIARLSQASQHL